MTTMLHGYMMLKVVTSAVTVSKLLEQLGQHFAMKCPTREGKWRFDADSAPSVTWNAHPLPMLECEYSNSRMAANAKRLLNKKENASGT